MEDGGRDLYGIQWVFHWVTFRLFVAIVLFVAVVDTIFLIHWFDRRLLPPYFVPPDFVCVVFQSASAFNSDISKWNTGAVASMLHSKSLIECCFFCLLFLLLTPYFWLLTSSPPPPFTVLFCLVFYSASTFNSDISAWNTGAVTTMSHSKSFIDWCFFCLWQWFCLLL